MAFNYALLRDILLAVRAHQLQPWLFKLGQRVNIHDLFMKNYSVAIIFLAFTILGCKEKTDDYLISECVGASFYYLDNQSTANLLVDFGDPGLNQQIDTATVINSGQRKLVGQDASFGSIPPPTETFASFELYKLSGGKKTLVYKQDPVQNSLWFKRKQNPNDPDFGCQQVDYTLRVTDAMLK
ncbi:hypothetical protein [Dyadobacter sp.]|uniref:hypothetical protein n=1 Tax=Dyadobacter sp. TaxID=1914288 RepID=UPI003F6FD1CC